MNKWITRFRQRLAPHFHKKEIFISPERKFVSFTFDDVPRSAFDYAVPAMKKYNVRGTFYVVLSMMEGVSGEKAIYGAEDLKKALSAGNELGCHTFGHIRFHQAGDVDFIEKDLIRNQSVLNENGIAQDLRNFSYPFGEQTVKSRKILTRRFLSSRGIKPGINAGKTDLNNLKAIKLYEGHHPIGNIHRMIEDFDQQGGWLIFYTHDIQADYSEFGCSEAYF
ncbi:MAG: polysaccharide deacetylase family protein, partial [Bacteroidota bacterium]